MFIGAIEIRREGYIGHGYGSPDPSKPFLAKIEVHGSRTKTEMMLSPELSERIVAIIADEVAVMPLPPASSVPLWSTFT